MLETLQQGTGEEVLWRVGGRGAGRNLAPALRGGDVEVWRTDEVVELITRTGIVDHVDEQWWRSGDKYAVGTHRLRAIDRQVEWEDYVEYMCPAAGEVVVVRASAGEWAMNEALCEFTCFGPDHPAALVLEEHAPWD